MAIRLRRNDEGQDLYFRLLDWIANKRDVAADWMTEDINPLPTGEEMVRGLEPGSNAELLASVPASAYDLAMPRQRWEVGLEALTGALPSTFILRKLGLSDDLFRMVNRTKGYDRVPKSVAPDFAERQSKALAEGLSEREIADLNRALSGKVQGSKLTLDDIDFVEPTEIDIARSKLPKDSPLRSGEVPPTRTEPSGDIVDLPSKDSSAVPSTDVELRAAFRNPDGPEMAELLSSLRGGEDVSSFGNPHVMESVDDWHFMDDDELRERMLYAGRRARYHQNQLAEMEFGTQQRSDKI